MSSAICFNLDQSKILSSGNGLKDLRLTFYHTIPTFNNLEKEAFGKHCGKRQKCCISPFPTMFSTLPFTNFNSSHTLSLSSANALNLDKYKIL